MRTTCYLAIALLVSGCKLGDDLPSTGDLPDLESVTVTTPEDTAIEVPDEAVPELSDTGIAVSDPAHGTISESPWRYTPDLNFHGSDQFTVTLTSGGATETATVTVTVTPVNDAPIASPAATTTDQNVAATIPLEGTDVDADPLSFAVSAEPAHGSVTIADATDIATYTPDSGFVGADSFQVTANDGTVDSAPVTITVTVEEVPGSPVAVDDTAEVAEDSSTGVLIDVVDNDEDPDGTTLIVTAVTQGSNGVAAIEGGMVRFTPAANFSGATTFGYSVTDGSGLSATAEVAVTVTPVNDAPVATAATLTVAEDASPLAITLAGADIDSTTLTFSATAPSKGDLSSLTSQSPLYTPRANANGQDSFTYTVSDGALSDQKTITINITPVNDAPSIVADTADTTKNVAVLIDVLANDSDVDGDVLDVQLTGTQANGTAMVVPGTAPARDKILFIPDKESTETGAFSYTISDGTVTSSSATVTVAVSAANVAPVANAAAVTTNEDTALPITLTSNEGGVTFAIVTSPTHGSLSVAGAAVTYTPAANYNGPDAFTFKANDGAFDSNVATISITVTAVNDAPTADAETIAVIEGVANAIPVASLLDGDTDAEGSPLAVNSVGGAVNGTVSLIPAAGTPTHVQFIPNTGVTTARFTYTVTDGALSSAAATVSLTVTPAVLECADGEIDEGEECDDGNTSDGDGCSATCTYESAPNTLASGNLANCSVAASNTGRKVAADKAGNIYVAMKCDGNTYVSVSNNGGLSFSASPINLNVADAVEVAVVGGRAGYAYAAVLTGDGKAKFTYTDDAGTTWKPSVILGPTADNEISLQAYVGDVDDDVFVGVGDAEMEAEGGITIYRGTNGANFINVASVGATNTASQIYFDLVYDAIQRKLFICTDKPEVAISTGSFSAGGALTFANPLSTGDTVYYSDWTASKGVVFMVGQGEGSDKLRYFLTSDLAAAPITSVPVAGLPLMPPGDFSNERAVAADLNGNAYVVSRTDSGTIRLDRARRAGNTSPAFSFESYREFKSSDVSFDLLVGNPSHPDVDSVVDQVAFPGVGPLPSSKGAVVVYNAINDDLDNDYATESKQRVFVTVQTY